MAIKHTGESRLPCVEYTGKSLLPCGEYIGESQLPCVEYNGGGGSRLPGPLITSSITGLQKNYWCIIQQGVTTSLCIHYRGILTFWNSFFLAAATNSLVLNIPGSWLRRRTTLPIRQKSKLFLSMSNGTRGNCLMKKDEKSRDIVPLKIANISATSIIRCYKHHSLSYKCSEICGRDILNFLKVVCYKYYLR